MFPLPSPDRPRGPEVEARQHAGERVTRARVLRSAQVGAATTDGTAAAEDHEQQGAHGWLPAGARRGNQGRPASVRAGRDAQAASAPDLVAQRGTAGPGQGISSSTSLSPSSSHPPNTGHADMDTTEHAEATGHGRGDAAIARRQLAQRHRRERQEREESASSRSLGSHDTEDDDEASASDNSAGTPEELAEAAAARRPQRAAERWTDGGRAAARRPAQHQELPAYHPPPLSDGNAGEQRALGLSPAAPAQAQAHASQGSRGTGLPFPPSEEPRTAHTPSPKRAMEESAAADEHRRRAQVARAYSPSHLGASRAAQAARVRALWSQGGEAPSTGAGMGEMADMADMGASEHAIAARASPHAAPVPHPLPAPARVLPATNP
ncbi:hypothetical protein B484DRAFT_436350, partial [Ochromonadaceae sp. CCMP2298]